MSIYTTPKPSRKVSGLAKLYEKGQVSDLTAKTLNKLADMEISQGRADLEATEKDLQEFEKRYQISTEEFFKRWQAGKMGDDMDYVEWASLAQMAHRIRERLEILASESQK
jgi:hypothetical protein